MLPERGAAPAPLRASALLPVYAQMPVRPVSGHGSWLVDEQSQEWLDAYGGHAVASTGHSHPRVVHAIADQAATLIQTSNLYYHPLQGQLAARLAALSGLQRAFFCNSGGEAVEGCLKFARRYWFSQGMKKRADLIRSLLHGPDLWILDEPLAGLDAGGSELLEAMIVEAARSGRTVLLVTHQAALGERLADDGAHVEDGRVVGRPAPSPLMG